jgi:uncharacterized membrane protein YdfJ with MMPL/SSD domain
MKSTLLQRIALASARHPRRTIGAWVAAMLIAFVAIGTLLGGALTTEGNPTNNPQSQRAKDVREAAFPAASSAGITDIVDIRSSRYTVESSRFRTLVRTLAGEVSDTKDVKGVRTYLTTRDPSLVSQDRHATMLQLAMPDESSSGIDDVISAVRRADASPAFAVTVTGQRTVNHDFNKLSEDDLRSGELQFGLPAALIVLLLVFGTVVAGLVPLLIALPSIIVALSFVAVLGHVFSLSVFTINMLTGMGLALGIDYALFVVSRFREERGRGREKLDAISASAMTANRAVLFSGTTFVIAMFGMFIVPSSIMRSLAVGAILVGIVSVVASATLLPALLGALGDRVNSLRMPFFGRRSGEADPESRVWGAVVRSVLRRPVLAAGLSVALLLAFASPIFGLHIGTSGPTLLPTRFEARQGFEALQRDFPGATANPVEIVVAKGARQPVVEALSRLRLTLASDPQFGAGQIARSSNGEVAMLSVPVRGDPSGDAAVSAVRHLRSTTVPAAFEATNAEVLVGGTTSENIDYFDSVIGPAPWVIAFVLGLTLVFLTVVFRSLVVAGTAVVLNLLSVSAAYGLLVLVFQDGFASGLLGFNHVDTIEAWVPLFLFSVLFGLSMDYQVFLLSRIRERYDETGDTTDAVTFGVASTARIITGAALIIVAVFAGFAAGELVMFQQMGFGVAVALLIDATIIRSVLLPAVMHMLGRWNWYLPHWLDWLPRLQVEGPALRAAHQ